MDCYVASDGLRYVFAAAFMRQQAMLQADNADGFASIPTTTMVEVPRFELPLDLKELETISPMEYLERYVIVQARVRRTFYHKVFNKYRDPKTDLLDGTAKLKSALLETCSNAALQTSQASGPSDYSLEYFIRSLLCIKSPDATFTFKQFIGMAALVERVFHPSYSSLWAKHDRMLEESGVLGDGRRAQHGAARPSTSSSSSAIAAAGHLGGAASSDHSESDADAGLGGGGGAAVAPSGVLVAHTSITDVLDMNSRPHKVPKETLEQLDFHALKWKLEGVRLNSNMAKLIKVIDCL